MADTKNGRRLGRFHIGLNLIDERAGADGTMAKLMLSGMIILRADHRYDLDAIEYMALHDDFDEVPAGQEAPHYDVVAHEQRIDDGEEGVGRTIMVFEKWQRRA